MNRIKVAALQLPVTADKDENIRRAGAYLEKLKSEKPDFVILPEMFCCPYQSENFPLYAEEEGGPVYKQLSAFAREYNIYLVGGTMPERDENGNIYNTCYVFDRSGSKIAKYRKTHLFDVDIKGGQYFKESDTLTAGDSTVVFDTEFGRMGVIICFDIRFPEIVRLAVDEGAKVVFVPASFNMTTGPVHWQLLFRSRALDNQIYMVGCSSARDQSASYKSWGHSLVTDPWGTVIKELDEKEGILITELDLAYEEKVRAELPLLRSRRDDLYRLEKV